MKKAMSCGLLLLALGFPLLAQATKASSDYLFVWAMEAQHPDASTMALKPTDLAGQRKALGLGRDFLAVFDARPGPSFGKLITMLPTGAAVMAHHTSYAEPPDHLLYANDWLANRTYVFDLHDAMHPKLLRQFGSIGALGYPHSFAYLPNGDTLATFQYSGKFNQAAGGLVEFDPQGKVVRTVSAAVAGHPNIRPYSMTVIPQLDRIVTSSADMMAAQVSHVVQVWRLSDLKLIKTLQLPPAMDWIYDTAADSSEPRVLADGKTVVVPTFNCGLFLLKNLASNEPTLQHVYDFGYRTCEVPVVAGDYLVETMQSGHAIASLDMHDSQHPREVSRILLPANEYPHWLALEPGGNRLVITGYGALATKVRFATIDRSTGQLTLDPQTLDFTRTWPDGWKGSAMPHGAVFSNP
ncbi:hypothetical protein PY254_12330 [Rhodanobacter sp. AS-Z3]|uniref:YncE family protein n=1 Tax=Rhodanobacter sp. AS-Z3 TaxID=3031330 RepID=UPI00247AFB6C|nr:hypothetical protein [Rhodanobacter sp. AS-Z3]WEN14021.1 hypothetical protein PY254_12330 [Rhodanobacter sp. AS-Z3]